jgi:hypothetical protein
MRRCLALLLFWLAALPAYAQAPSAGAALHGPRATAAAILRSELAFEARSEQAGAATAFRENMDATDGLEFGGGAPLRGAAAIGAAMDKAPAGATLRWTPREVFASTGDMGVVWGQWSLSGKSGKPVTGRYVTVWRRNAAGLWKALVDIGTPD